MCATRLKCFIKRRHLDAQVNRPEKITIIFCGIREEEEEMRQNWKEFKISSFGTKGHAR